jgi:transposase
MSGKRGKNDAADAAAICEAVTRPNMRFVPVKDVDQQAILCLHRTRQGFIEERTALYNRLRGLISEFGIVLPQKVERLRREIGAHLEELPGWANRCVGDLLVHADRLNERIEEYDKAIAQAAKQDRKLMQLPGIGPTTASALVASLGGGHDFKNGRQLAAWAGLVPANTAVAAKPDWAGSPKRATPTCAVCWSWAPDPSLPDSVRSRTGSAAGREVWLNDGVTGKLRSLSPPRTCGSPGR